ncbi:hypothetical protein BN1723_019487, partial [Verticillium longisporum]
HHPRCPPRFPRPPRLQCLDVQCQEEARPLLPAMPRAA